MMKLVIVSDIFGKTESIKKLMSDISPYYSEIELITPYGNTLQKFGDENEAYQKFVNEIGIDGYVDILLFKLKGSEERDQILVGFSVGATAVWLASELVEGFRIKKAICFYSSQIRKHLSVTPKIPLDIYFAKKEPNYKVEEVMTYLGTRENLTCHRTSYLHGFMNKDSINYSVDAYNHYLGMLKST